MYSTQDVVMSPLTIELVHNDCVHVEYIHAHEICSLLDSLTLTVGASTCLAII